MIESLEQQSKWHERSAILIKSGVIAAGTIAGVWIYNLQPKEESMDIEPEVIN